MSARQAAASAGWTLTGTGAALALGGAEAASVAPWRGVMVAALGLLVALAGLSLLARAYGSGGAGRGRR